MVLSIIFGILGFNFLLNILVDYLNTKYSTRPLPPELQGIYDDEKYQQSIAYRQAREKFGYITGSLNFVITIVLLATGGFALFSDWFGAYFTNEIAHALAFFGGLMFVSGIFGLPFDWYSTFVIEEKFGFNKSTLKTFILDKIKGSIVGTIFGGLLGFALLALILELGESFWWYFWAVMAGFMLFMNAFYATLIIPIFNKLTPLEDGALRQEIENYAEKVRFPLTNILVIDGSKRSTKANAFFSGLGKTKKIVLYDTLIENHSVQELTAVLAHEVGHYKKNHIPVSMVLGVLQIGFMLWLLSKFVFSQELSMALGASESYVHLNLMAFGMLYSPISMLLGILMNGLSRKNEFEADRYARDTYDGEALSTALKTLSSNNLSNLMPHPLNVFLNYSHPALRERLQALKN